jgi:hypothetical protein
MRTWQTTCVVLLALLSHRWNTQAAMLVRQEPMPEEVQEQLQQLQQAPKDSWYRHPPTELIIEPVKKSLVKWDSVDPADVHRVVPQKWPKAEAMLEKQWFYKLTVDQAQEFIGKQVPKPIGKTPYLVPAVYYDRGQGKFYLGTLDKYLWINHDSLGPWPTAMKRDALVVFLKKEPERLFVTCGRTV